MSKEAAIEYLKNRKKELEKEINGVEDWVNTGEEEEELEVINETLKIYEKQQEQNKKIAILRRDYGKTHDIRIQIQKEYIPKSRIYNLINELETSDSMEEQIVIPYLRKLLI